MPIDTKKLREHVFGQTNQVMSPEAKGIISALCADHDRLSEELKIREALVAEALELAEKAVCTMVVPGPSASGNAEFARIAFLDGIAKIRQKLNG